MFKKIYEYIKLKYLFFKYEREIKKEVKTTVDGYFAQQTVQDVVQKAYAEGLAQVKKKINEQAVIEGHEQILEKKPEILPLAELEDQNRKKVVEGLRKVYVYKKEKPKEAMIGDRISHYYKLQKSVEEKSLLRAIRKARKENNEQLAEELETRWKSEYGRTGKA